MAVHHAGTLCQQSMTIYPLTYTDWQPAGLRCTEISGARAGACHLPARKERPIRRAISSASAKAMNIFPAPLFNGTALFSHETENVTIQKRCTNESLPIIWQQTGDPCPH
jgi:hypothetical protein